MNKCSWYTLKGHYTSLEQFLFNLWPRYEFIFVRLHAAAAALWHSLTGFLAFLCVTVWIFQGRRSAVWSERAWQPGSQMAFTRTAPSTPSCREATLSWVSSTVVFLPLPLCVSARWPFSFAVALLKAVKPDSLIHVVLCGLFGSSTKICFFFLSNSASSAWLSLPGIGCASFSERLHFFHCSHIFIFSPLLRKSIFNLFIFFLLPAAAIYIFKLKLQMDLD